MSRSTGSGWTRRRSPRRSSAASSVRRRRERSPSGRSTPPPIPTPIPSCSCLARSYSAGRRPGRPERPPQLVGVRARRVLEAAGGKGTTINGRDTHPVVHIAYEEPRRTRRGQGRSCRPRPSGSSPRGVDSRARCSHGATRRPRWQGDGEHVAGRVPLAEPEARRLRGNVTGRKLRAERLRPLRRDGERLGVDIRLVHRSDTDEVESPCCVPRNPRACRRKVDARRRDDSRAA